MPRPRPGEDSVALSSFGGVVRGPSAGVWSDATTLPFRLSIRAPLPIRARLVAARDQRDRITGSG